MRKHLSYKHIIYEKALLCLWDKSVRRKHPNECMYHLMEEAESYGIYHGVTALKYLRYPTLQWNEEKMKETQAMGMHIHRVSQGQHMQSNL